MVLVKEYTCRAMEEKKTYKYVPLTVTKVQNHFSKGKMSLLLEQWDIFRPKKKK